MKPTFLILSASKGTKTKEENARQTEKLRRHLLIVERRPFLPVRGCYVSPVTGETEVEDSFLVPYGLPDDPLPDKSMHLAWLSWSFGQESILLDTDGQGQLLFPDGHTVNLGRRTPGISPSGYTSTILGDFHYA